MHFQSNVVGNSPYYQNMTSLFSKIIGESSLLPSSNRLNYELINNAMKKSTMFEEYYGNENLQKIYSDSLRFALNNPKPSYTVVANNDGQIEVRSNDIIK